MSAVYVSACLQHSSVLVYFYFECITMSSTVRTPASKAPLFSESNNFQDQDHTFITGVDGTAPNFIKIRRIRFWLSTLLKALILIGVVVSLISLVRLWGDYQCRKQDHIDVLLPCTPLDTTMYLDEVRRPAAREVWCSAPLVFVDPSEYDCYTILTFGESYPATNVTCHKVNVTYQAWYPTNRPTEVGTGLRVFHPTVQITVAFAFTCSNDEPKSPTDFSVPIERNLCGKEYLLASYFDE